MMSQEPKWMYATREKATADVTMPQAEFYSRNTSTSSDTNNAIKASTHHFGLSAMIIPIANCHGRQTE
jgi:hypothetical protein